MVLYRTKHVDNFVFCPKMLIVRFFNDLTIYSNFSELLMLFEI